MNTKLIVCKCGASWRVTGERVPFTLKFRVPTWQMRCGQCGHQNTVKESSARRFTGDLEHERMKDAIAGEHPVNGR